MKLPNRRALITGASQGLGLAIARAFLTEGARIVLCARGTPALEQARRELQAAAQGRVEARRADVSDATQVDELIRFAEERLGGLDVLVCNAGVYGPKGPLAEVSAADWWSALEINLKGTMLCCRAAIPALKAAGRGKIVLLSGGGATKPLPGLSAYAASKAAVVRFGETLAHELAPFRIDVNCVAPGSLNTRLLDEVLEAGPEKVGKAFHEKAVAQKREGGTPLERGAGLCVWLASAASDGITGRLLSAVWDPWERLDARRADLEATDIYTLRRIGPEDRKKDWS